MAARAACGGHGGAGGDVGHAVIYVHERTDAPAARRERPGRPVSNIAPTRRPWTLPEKGRREPSPGAPVGDVPRGTTRKVVGPQAEKYTRPRLCKVPGLAVAEHPRPMRRFSTDVPRGTLPPIERADMPPRHRPALLVKRRQVARVTRHMVLTVRHDTPRGRRFTGMGDCPDLADNRRSVTGRTGTLPARGLAKRLQPAASVWPGAR